MVESLPAGGGVSFVVVDDTAAWPDPTADAIFRQLLTQAAGVDPAPTFLVNLGDFAGPGTAERHEHYLRLVDGLPFPDVCVVGNHDLDDPHAATVWAQLHGRRNFSFAHADARLVALDAAPSETTAGTWRCYCQRSLLCEVLGLTDSASKRRSTRNAPAMSSAGARGHHHSRADESAAQIWRGRHDRQCLDQLDAGPDQAGCLLGQWC
jgi:hypothetical protein